MIVFAILAIFFFLTTVALFYYVVKFGKIILEFQDTLGDALDVIDEKYSSISEICERPLFYDSREVREVLSSVKSTRDALHEVAYSLTEDFSSGDVIDDQG